MQTQIENEVLAGGHLVDLGAEAILHAIATPERAAGAKCHLDADEFRILKLARVLGDDPREHDRQLRGAFKRVLDEQHFRAILGTPEERAAAVEDLDSTEATVAAEVAVREQQIANLQAEIRSFDRQLVPKRSLVKQHREAREQLKSLVPPFVHKLQALEHEATPPEVIAIKSKYQVARDFLRVDITTSHGLESLRAGHPELIEFANHRWQVVDFQYQAMKQQMETQLRTCEAALAKWSPQNLDSDPRSPLNQWVNFGLKPWRKNQ